MLSMYIYTFIQIFVILVLVVSLKSQDIICPAKCVCSAASRTSSVRARCGEGIKIESLDEINLNNFNNLSDIIALDLSNNEISHLKSHSFPLRELQKLDLSKNEIDRIDEGAFDGLVGLKRLDLSHNKLRYLTRSMFSGLVSLDKLKLSQNFISHIRDGVFDDLKFLKTLDVVGNPLVCDCDMWWLASGSGQIKLSPAPKCSAPPSQKGQPLRKLKPIGGPIPCPWNDGPPASDLALELSPNHDQVVFEGDRLELECRAGRVSGASGVPPGSIVSWHWAGLPPEHVFPTGVEIDNRPSVHSGLLESWLRIDKLTTNHTGDWDCELTSSEGNHSTSVSVIVLSESTKYCLSTVTVDNKGSYSWPKTVAGHVVELPCQAQLGIGYARHNCTLKAEWAHLNTSVCPYISETTRILQQYARMNLTANRGNVLENAETLHNYSVEHRHLLRDPMDIVYLAQTIYSFVRFVNNEKTLGVLLLDLISNMLELPRELLAEAERLDGSCSKLLSSVETITQYIPMQSHKANMAVEEFFVSRDNFLGTTCTWLRSGHDRTFRCSNGTSAFTSQDKILEASVQIPRSLLQQLQPPGSRHHLLVAMFDNDKLFPSANSTSSMLVTSSIVGTKLVGVNESWLGGVEGIIVTLGGVGGRPAWWDAAAREWRRQACQPTRASAGLLVLQCNRLGYYTLLGDAPISPHGHIHQSRAEQMKSRPAAASIYIGTFIGSTCLLVAVFTYAICHASIVLPSAMKHALANNWLSIAGLSIIFSNGIYQTENLIICRSVGLLIHYFTLCSLFWMAITINALHRSGRERVPPVPAAGSVSEEGPRHRPTFGLYLVGWGVSMLLVGLSGAVNPEGYASPSFCALGPGPGFTPLLVPIFALFIFIFTRSLMVQSAAGEKDSNAQLSEGTQATDLETVRTAAIPPILEPEDRASVMTPSSQAEDPEHSPAVHLRAAAIVTSCLAAAWTVAAVAVLKPFDFPAEEAVFSAIYAVLMIVMGIFVVYFYCLSRSDVRSVWFTLQPLLRGRTVSDSHRPLPRAPSANSIALKSLSTRQDTRVDLVDLHRRQYGNERVLSEDAFFNPHQSVVARKFFRKQRRLRGDRCHSLPRQASLDRRRHHRHGRRSADGSDSELFRPGSGRLPLERLVIGAEAADSVKYASVVSDCCSCRVSEAHSDCTREVLSERSSRCSSHVYASVGGGPTCRLLLDPGREVARIRLVPPTPPGRNKAISPPGSPDKRETPV